MIHLLRVPAHAHPNFDEDHDDHVSWPTLCSHHRSKYPHHERFMTRDEQGVPVMGYLQMTLNAQDIPWVMAWLKGEPEEVFGGISLSIHNCGIFPIDYIPVKFGTYLRKSMRLRGILEEIVRSPGI